MGIQLDWEVEDEHGWDSVGEDPEVATRRRRRRRRLRGWLLVAIATVALIGGGVMVGLRRSRDQANEALGRTIEAEVLTLRIGDREAFNELQSADERWRALQTDTFDNYQALGGRLEAGGEVIDLSVDHGEARAVLREELDGLPARVTWFYRQEDGAWRHVAPPADAWGPRQTISTPYFDLTFHEADRATATALADSLGEWWEAACELIACREMPPRTRIVVTAEPGASLGWSHQPAGDASWTLAVPSPLLRRIPETGDRLEPALHAALNRLAADRWAAYAVRPANPNLPVSADMPWVEAQFSAWLLAEVGGAPADDGLFAPLAAAYGPDIVPALLAMLRTGEGLVPSLVGLTGIPPLDQPVDWQGALAARLRADAEALASAEDNPDASTLIDPTGRMEPQPLIDTPTERWAAPETITVAGIEPIGDKLLAEVHFTGVVGSPLAGESAVSYEAFALGAMGWERADLSLEDWGEVRGWRSAHFALNYPDLDGPFIADLALHLEGVREQLAADLMLDEAAQQRILMTLSPLEPSVLLARYDPGFLRAYDMLIWLTSPYAATHPPDLAPADALQAQATWSLVQGVVAEQAPGVPVDYAFLVAFMGWELDRLDVPREALLPEDQAMLATGEEIEVLLALAEQAGGEETIPALLAALPGARSVDGWLAAGLSDADTAALREDWAACLADQLECPLDSTDSLPPSAPAPIEE